MCKIREFRSVQRKPWRIFHGLPDIPSFTAYEVSCRARIERDILSKMNSPQKMVPPLYICKLGLYNFNEKLYFVILHYSVAFVN